MSEAESASASECTHQNVEWHPEDADPTDPVEGTCTGCGETCEHYCDNFAPDISQIERDGAGCDGARYALEYDCPHCERHLKLVLHVDGTYDEDGTLVYTG